MYEERRDKFSIKDIIIQVLFVAIFIFLLMWLFPMKKDVKNALKGVNSDGLQPLYDQVFNSNIQTMKDAAINYYTTPRLPEKVGQEKKMTLDYMLKNNLVLPFVDSDGNQCDLLESYVSITKMSEEYILKVSLKCSNQEDYILVHLGCYNYCEDGICEKEEETPVVNPTPTPKPTPTPTPTPEPEPVVNDKYEYEYVKVIDGKWGEWSNWSDWTENVITSTDYRVVETKTETKTTYETKITTTTVPVYETVEEEYTCYDTEIITEDKPIYEYQQVGTKPVVKTEEVEVEVTKYRDVSYIIKYEDKWVCNDICQTVSEPVWGTRQEPYTTTEIQTKSVTVDEPVYNFVLVGTEKVEKEIEVEDTCYDTEEVFVGTREETKTEKVPVTTEITYYRSKTREYISGTTDTKWSTSQNDKTLLSQDYTLTGNSRKI